ncbi:MAG TPA: ABC transporter permease [Bryobacteraceae bacterium]|nr:ABC transporter permease [Bryobacteraceae bacterium]
MLKFYRILLHLYPTAFREEYAKAMEHEFRDELAEAQSGFPVVWLWMRLLLDFTTSLPVQLAIEIGRDSRHALRLWAKRPWQTGFAVIALGVAIGANTGVFSVVNALLLRSLPFRDPAGLAALIHFLPPHDSAAQFDSWRRHSNYLQDAALFEDGDLNIGEPQHMLRAHITMTSRNFFSLLGSVPVIGRTFASEDHAVAVISYGLWQELYAGSDKVLGKTIRVYGLQPRPDEPLRIIGVMPANFDYPASTVLWKSPEYTRGNNGWAAIGRLEPGIGWTKARAAFAADVHHLEPHRRFRADWIPMMMPLADELAGHVKNASLLLMGVAVLILLIACANLANLMLARTADRQHELSVRSALGASRARLIQQILTECLLLAIVSAGLGLIVAVWATSLASKVQPAPLPSQTYTILDVRVLAFMVGVAVLSAVLFGLLPALSVGRIHLFVARGSTELRSSRIVRDVLVAAQVTLTIVLLTASVSVIQAVSHELHIDRGFRADGVVTASVALDGTVRDKPGLRLQYFEQVLNRLRRLPEVRNASSTEFLPLLSGKFMGGPYAFDGHPSAQGMAADVIPIMADYFATTGGHVLYGREFTDAEVRSNAKVLLVNETFARLWLRPADAVGHMVTGPDGTVRKIVGVVRNLDFMGQYISDVFDVDPPETFIPAHNPGGFDSTFVVKVEGRPEDQVAAIQAALQSVDSGVPVYGVETMQQRMDRAFARPKFYRTALAFFASFALLLALIGIYAVVSYAVTQRTHEMGVRLALGTTPTRLRTRLVRHGLATVVVGALGGIACAASTGKLLGGLIEGAKGFDVATYVLATIFICLVAAASIWVATRRIANMDVVEILRAE